MVHSLGGVVSWFGRNSNGNFSQLGAAATVAGKDSVVIVSDSQVFSCEHEGTPNIAKLAALKELGITHLPQPSNPIMNEPKALLLTM
jgi:hypothetical protein